MELDKPNKPTNVYMVLHESARYPRELFYEYMIGSLRNDLNNQKYGHPLTDAGYERAREVGKKLRDKGIMEIVTDEFITPLETARVIADEIGNPKIIYDIRISESNLSYLSKERLSELEKMSSGDPFVFTRDWYYNCNRVEKRKLIQDHVAIWKETIKRNNGNPHAYVLHVEGMQFFVNELLERPRDKMVDLHFKRGNYVHVQVFPDKGPLISL